MGLTNNVQPYCRLAIITMQMMPKMSWPQRVAGDAKASDRMAVDAVVMCLPQEFCLLLAELDYTPICNPLTFRRRPQRLKRPVMGGLPRCGVNGPHNASGIARKLRFRSSQRGRVTRSQPARLKRSAFGSNRARQISAPGGSSQQKPTNAAE